MTNGLKKRKEAFCFKLNKVLDELGAPSRGRPRWLKARWDGSFDEQISEKTFYKWVTGQAKPEDRRIKMLSDALGRDLTFPSSQAAELHEVQKSTLRRGLNDAETAALYQCLQNAKSDLELLGVTPGIDDILRVGVLNFNKRLIEGVSVDDDENGANCSDDPRQAQ